nr:mannosyl-oligosaccharide 1,2-alpha-mannosidase [Quercus suber]
MNNRDPFNLRGNNSAPHRLLQTGRTVAHRTVTKVVETGRNIVSTAETRSEMAQANGWTAQRNRESWQSSPQTQTSANTFQQNVGGVGEAISGMFGGDGKQGLPMYKDKPYSYPGGRKLPWYKRRRVFAVIVTTFVLVIWWSGIFAPSSSTRSGKPKPKASSTWGLTTSKAADWDARAEAVRDAFKMSFADYEKHAWGYDEYHPASKGKRQMTPKGMGWIIVDALDTMMLMNLTTELTHARQWVNSNLTYDQDHDVNTFETTIRMLGGLLSAHYLSTEFPGKYAPVDDGLSDDLYVEKAVDLADRLLSAFETSSGVPLASVNLHTRKGIPSHADGGASSTAEATSVQLEFKYLAKLTGEDHYWDTVENVMKVIDRNHAKDGLVPIFISANDGHFRGQNIRLGSRGDSYYEYLIKQYYQTSEKEPIYKDMWKESLDGVKKHLITYSKPSRFTVLAERPSGLNSGLSPKMDHLVCFMPSAIALGATGGLPIQKARKSPLWTAEMDEDMRLAEELMNTCWGMYTTTKTGLAGEITHFNIFDPPLIYNDFNKDTRPSPPKNFDLEPVSSPGEDTRPVGADDFIVKPSDAHNLQRPETIESLFYMWRITGDIKYRNWGWQMFENFVKHTKTQDDMGYSSIDNVQAVPPPLRDNMESFWLVSHDDVNGNNAYTDNYYQAETLKYFYLLFSPDDILPLNDVVFNTEAHAFPRFEMGKLFKTGWSRGDSDGSVEKNAEQKTVLVQTQTITMEAGKATKIANGANEKEAAPLHGYQSFSSFTNIATTITSVSDIVHITTAAVTTSIAAATSGVPDPAASVDMADFSYSEDTELKELNERVKQHPEEFEHWEKLIARAEDQEGGLNRNSSESAIAGVREVYDLFLARFPLFFGYWKKYADLEFAIAGPEAAELVYERGVASIGISVDLWANYCGFKTETSHDFDVIRELFQRGAECVGLDFLAHPFWDKYIEFEERIEAQGNIFKILERVVHIPMHQYARYFERYRTMGATRAVEELGPESLLKQLSAEIVQENAGRPMTDAETERDLRLKIDNFNMEVFKQIQTETTKRWTYEQEIKRPYYHVTELDESQLANWRRYLDFEEAEGDYARTRFLYERCLVTAANYEEFWFRYARWQSANGKKEEVRNIYQRASCIYVPISKPEIRLAYAAFEESLERVDIAIDIHEAILSRLQSDVETIISLVNLQRRQYGMQAAIKVLSNYLANITYSVETKGQLMAEWMRLSSLSSEPTDTRKLYEEHCDQYLDSEHFWKSWLSFELKQQDNATNAGIVLGNIRQKTSLSRPVVRELAISYMTFLKEQGGKDSMKEYIELDQEINGPVNVQNRKKRKFDKGPDANADADVNADAVNAPKRLAQENGFAG